MLTAKTQCPACGRKDVRVKGGRYAPHFDADGRFRCEKGGEVAQVKTRKPINPHGPRGKLWAKVEPVLKEMFTAAGLKDICEARISPHCTGRGECFLHGRKRNKDHHIGPLTTFVIRGCGHCGLYVDQDMKPTKMFDFIWSKIQDRGWMPLWDWRDRRLKVEDNKPLEYPVAVLWVNGPPEAPNYKGYELETSGGGCIPLADSDEAAMAAATWGLQLRES